MSKGYTYRDIRTLSRTQLQQWQQEVCNNPDLYNTVMEIIETVRQDAYTKGRTDIQRLICIPDIVIENLTRGVWTVKSFTHDRRGYTVGVAFKSINLEEMKGETDEETPA